MPGRKCRNNNKIKNVWRNIRLHFISCANICSIHGIAHIVRKNISPYERLLWFLLVTSATAWCIVLALEAWDHYQTRPTVISIERDHLNWNTTFPSATFCLDSIDTDRLGQLVSTMNISEDLQPAFVSFIKELAIGNYRTYHNFAEYMNHSLFQNVDKYIDWLLNTQRTLENVEISQAFGNLGLFESIFTEFGMCFVYNSQIAVYSSPKYRQQNTMKLVKTNETIMVNPSISSPLLSLTNLFGGFKIFFHGPYEIPDISTKGFDIRGATFSTFNLIVDTVTTPPEVKDLRISQRNCRLPEESNLKHSPVYSYNLCRIECRIKLCLKLCDCIPYYYRTLANERICSPSGLYCLSKYKDIIVYLRDENNKSSCPCLQNCDIDTITIAKYEINDFFMGTTVEWKLTQYPRIRYKRSLIFSGINLLVQIGGIAGLFLGCSILSLVELIYFFTLRFYWGVIRGRVIQ